MKKLIRLSVFVITASLVTGTGWYSHGKHQAVVELSKITIDRTTGDRLHNGKPFTGVAHQYDNELLVRAEEFRNGRRHGHFRMWFSAGNPAFESAYVNGRRNGASTSWWSNGQMRSQTWFVNDSPDGIAWSWYRSGEKFKRYNYVNGQPSGLQQGWRQNGKLFSNFEYRNGRAYGLRNSNLCVELKDEELSLDL